jgi:hypothetical protein
MKTYTIKIFKNGHLNLSVSGLSYQEAKRFQGAIISGDE